MTSVRRVGLIAATTAAPGVVGALRGSDHIVYAGDIGGPEILAAMAPHAAIRGNDEGLGKGSGRNGAAASV